MDNWKSLFTTEITMNMLVSSRGIATSCDIYPTHILSDNFQFDPKPYQNIQFKDTVYVVTTQLREFIDRILPTLISPFILVTGSSVLGTPKEVCQYTNINMDSLLADKRIIHWFCQNNDYSHPKVSPIPLGLDFHTLENSNHWWGPQQTPTEQNKRIHEILHTLPTTHHRPKIAYSTFHFMPNVRLEDDRNQAIDSLQNKPFVYFESNKQPREQLWKAHGEYRYILSPLGQGIDCHRTWEALALGSIPIVRKTTISPLFKKLPVIEINTWSEITHDFLHDQWLLLKHHLHRKPLYLNYWVKKIKSAQKA